MSGFQIPGLGQAKPNEVLPPLPLDLATAAASAAGNEDLPDAPELQTSENTTAATTTETEVALAKSSPAPEVDAMAVDEPAPGSPPSLTSALEAAIGGLDEPPQQEEQQQQPQEPEQQATQADPEPAELQNDTGDNPEWEIDSSPYESSSESSSDSSSDDDDDSDNEGYELLGVEETARMLLEAEGGSDDEGGPSGSGKTGSAAQLRTKNELADEEAPIPRPDVTITPDMKLEELGAIEHIVDTIALVTAVTPGEYQVLDSGSVLCTADRVVVGAVAETIGKVTTPMYTVRFSSVAEIAELGLAVGTTLYYTPAHATFVFTEPLKNIKGSDASNLYDEEAGDEEMEFSDDEKEAEHKRTLKQKKKDKWKANNPEKAAAAAAAAASRAKDHPLRQQQNVDGGLNYDEDEDGPYKPLARPSSLASGPGSSQYDQVPSSRPGGFQAGGAGGGRRGGGGDFRGRGRGGGRGGRGGYARGGGSSSYNNNSSSSRDGYSLPPQGHQQNHYVPPPPPPVPQGAFGMQFPGWPAAPAAPGGVPPPPPGWPGSVAVPPPSMAPPVPGGQQPGGGFNIDPAVLAAIMSQMQAQAANNNGGQQPPAWGQQPPRQ